MQCTRPRSASFPFCSWHGARPRWFRPTRAPSTAPPTASGGATAPPPAAPSTRRSTRSTPATSAIWRSPGAGSRPTGRSISTRCASGCPVSGNGNCKRDHRGHVKRTTQVSVNTSDFGPSWLSVPGLSGRACQDRARSRRQGRQPREAGAERSIHVSSLRIEEAVDPMGRRVKDWRRLAARRFERLGFRLGAIDPDPGGRTA